MKILKCVVVGDKDCDRTALLHAYTNNDFDYEGYHPSIFNNFSREITIDEQKVRLDLYDSIDKESSASQSVRASVYSQTDVFIVVYSVMNGHSFASAMDFWYPELLLFNDNPKIILVGTQIESRVDEAKVKELKIQNMHPMMFDDANKQAKAKTFVAHLECSVRHLVNVDLIFETAVREGLKPAVGSKSPQRNRMGSLFSRKTVFEKMTLDQANFVAAMLKFRMRVLQQGPTPLLDAVTQRDATAVKKLLEQGVTWEQRDVNGKSLLSIAALRQDETRHLIFEAVEKTKGQLLEGQVYSKDEKLEKNIKLAQLLITAGEAGDADPYLSAMQSYQTRAGLSDAETNIEFGLSYMEQSDLNNAEKHFKLAHSSYCHAWVKGEMVAAHYGLIQLGHYYDFLATHPACSFEQASIFIATAFSLHRFRKAQTSSNYIVNLKHGELSNKLKNNKEAHSSFTTAYKLLSEDQSLVKPAVLKAELANHRYQAAKSQAILSLQHVSSNSSSLYTLDKAEKAVRQAIKVYEGMSTDTSQVRTIKLYKLLHNIKTQQNLNAEAKYYQAKVAELMANLPKKLQLEILPKPSAPPLEEIKDNKVSPGNSIFSLFTPETTTEMAVDRTNLYPNL